MPAATGEPGVRDTTHGRWRTSLLLALACLLVAAPDTASAAGIDTQFPMVHQYFPQATGFGPVQGTPPAANVYQSGRIVGYVFESKMVAPIPAYSGEPIDILIAIDTTGRIVGAEVLEQHEPILLVGIPVQRLHDLVARYVGHSVKDKIVVGGSSASGTVKIDA